MLNLSLVHSFLKDPLTDKLVRRYVTSPKARKSIETAVHVVEILMIAMPLIDSAVKGAQDMFGKKEERRSGTRTTPRRSLPASSRTEAA